MMHAKSNIILPLLCASICITTSWAHAQGRSAKPNADAPPALEGPKVNRPAQQTVSLVQREFDGRLKRLEVEPVGAAIAMMHLPADARAAAQKVLIGRKTALDAILRENIPLVLRLDGAFKPGDNGEGQAALRELFEKAKPIIEKGVLLEQVAAVLPPSNAAELRRLYAEYMGAAVQDRLGSGPADKRNDRLGARIAEGFANFQREVEDSGKRVFEGGDAEFKELATKLELTPEQESKVQGIFLDMYANGNGKPTKSQQAGALLKSLALLTPEQKVKMREIMAQEARDSAKRAKEDKQALKPDTKPDTKPAMK